MVLSASLVFYGLSIFGVGQQYGETYCLNKASELRLAILSSTPGFIEQTSSPGAYTLLSGLPQRGHVAFGDSNFEFNAGTGKLEYLSGSGLIDSPPIGPASIGNTQAASIALTLATIIEGTEERITDVLPIRSGTNYLLVYDVHIFPAHQGVPFEGSDFGAWAELEHSTGKVLLFAPSRVPRCLPPTNMTPAVPMIDAEATVASHVGNISDPTPVVQLQPSNLAIFKPDDYTLGPDTFVKKSWFTPAELADFNANRGVLAYAVGMARIDTLIPEKDAHHTISICYVNAQTGNLMVELIATGLGAGIEGKPRRIAPFAGELDAGTLTINMGKRSVTIADAATTVVSPPKSSNSKNRMKVMLKRGRLFIQAEFDPESGLLRFGGKTPVWAKPNPPLLTALKELT